MARMTNTLELQPIVAGHADAVWAALGEPGAWWTGAERLAIAKIARISAPRPLWDRVPALDTLSRDRGVEGLLPFLVALAERLAVEPSLFSRDEVQAIAAEIGDAAYAELASVICSVVAIDQAATALGNPYRSFPAPEAGDPSRVRPEGMADVGGHIEMSEVNFGPNVARSLSLAGADHTRWQMLTFTMYAGEGFAEMVWDDRALSRPQVELLAARTSALNECFY